MKAYHFLRADLTAGAGTEPAWTVGETRQIKGRLKLSERGYHSSPSFHDALQFAPGPVACVVEIPTPQAGHRDQDKQVTKKRTLLAAANVERELRLFACECAERALVREREQGREPNPHSWATIDVVRRFVQGAASQEELKAAEAAAEAAAWAAWAAETAAAWAAAWAAVGAAAWAAETGAARAAARAARAAAEAAAGAAAEAAAGAAAGAAAEKNWQRTRLAEILDPLLEVTP